MSVCMCIYIYTYIHTYIHTYMHMHMHLVRSSSPSRCEVRVAISVVWERICSRSLLLPSFTVPSMSTSPSLASACVSISWLMRSHWRWRSRTDFRSASPSQFITRSPYTDTHLLAFLGWGLLANKKQLKLRTLKS